MPLSSQYPALDPAHIEQALQYINLIRAELPLALQLTPAEKHRHPTIKNKREPFVRYCIAISQSDPSVVPAYLSATYMQQKWNNFLLLQSLSSALAILQQEVEDTLHNEGHFAYMDALRLFDSIALARKSQVAGADTLHDTLSAFFEKKERKKKEGANE